ncbi:MAG: hypothetical protein ACMUHX_04770 [bacterium]
MSYINELLEKLQEDCKKCEGNGYIEKLRIPISRRDTQSKSSANVKKNNLEKIKCPSCNGLGKRPNKLAKEVVKFLRKNDWLDIDKEWSEEELELTKESIGEKWGNPEKYEEIIDLLQNGLNIIKHNGKIFKKEQDQKNKIEGDKNDIIMRFLNLILHYNTSFDK